MIHEAKLMAELAASQNEAGPVRIDNVSRRGILGGAGALVLALSLRPARADETQTQEQKEQKFGADGMPHGWRDDPTLFIAIAPDGAVTVTCTRAEMGQGVRTSVAFVIADELEADWGRVKVAQAHGDEERFGNQDTDGKDPKQTDRGTHRFPS